VNDTKARAACQEEKRPSLCQALGPKKGISLTFRIQVKKTA
jgi:hypothetical protein